MTKCKLCDKNDVMQDSKGCDLWYCEDCKEQRWQQAKRPLSAQEQRGYVALRVQHKMGMIVPDLTAERRREAWQAYQDYVTTYERQSYLRLIAHRHAVAKARQHGMQSDIDYLERQYKAACEQYEAMYRIEAAKLRKVYTDLVDCEV